MTVQIEELSERAGNELLAFEQENRAFFASVVPDRGDAYFVYDTFMENLKALIEENGAGNSYMYTVRCEDNVIAGRINLVNVRTDSSGSKTAELGYRIGEAYKGKGYATAAIRLALAEAEKHRIVKVEAMTASDNIGSQVVLMKNGFQQAGIRHGALHFEGNALDGIVYEKILHESLK
ncbi:GNAT family N-acetyltransferase [Alteribacter natronophilus]|uniref:GNAT family N-acetyltransferase n=1 Tax=Alteribacter natronophilus TaxID=2583810 RepID=UPI00110F430E|nr:GNAT family protein [Alteribacter natronophilus]TMW73319.1 GNAT family N-acetyltransferase [Alteribacter natronophilus]